MPLDFMLAVMRDPNADHKRRDAMAMAAAPYLHPRLTAIDAKLSPAVAQPSPQKLLLEFVLPTLDHARGDRSRGFSRPHYGSAPEPQLAECWLTAPRTADGGCRLKTGMLILASRGCTLRSGGHAALLSSSYFLRPSPSRHDR